MSNDANRGRRADLGPFLSEYSTLRRGPLHASMILLYFGVLAVLVVLLLLMIGETRAGIVAAVSTAIVGWIAVRLFRRGATESKVELYEGGVVHRDRAGECVLAWKDVRALYYWRVKYVGEDGVSRRQDAEEWNLVLERLDGKKASVTEPGAATIFQIAREEISPRLWAEARAHLSAGKAVAFGPIQVSRSGLSFKPTSGSKTSSQTLPWSAIPSIRIAQGELSIGSLSGPLGCWNVGEIANAWFLLALLENEFQIPVE